MRFLIIFLFLFSHVFAIEQADKKTQKAKVTNQINQITTQPTKKTDQAPPSKPLEKAMVIDVLKRAEDIVNTFTILKKDRTVNQISFNLTNKKTISNIIDITLSTNGTILIFKIGSNKGSKQIAVFIENIIGMTIS